MPRRRPSTRLSQATGLAILAAGVLALVLGGPSRSLALLIAGSVVSTGLLDLRFSLSASVDAVSVALVASALAAAVWQVRAESRPQPRERTI